jgi:hypothetical protein
LLLCARSIVWSVLNELQILLIYLFNCFWCLDSGLFVRRKQISLFFASFFVLSLFVFLLPLYPELV